MVAGPPHAGAWLGNRAGTMDCPLPRNRKARSAASGGKRGLSIRPHARG